MKERKAKEYTVKVYGDGTRHWFNKDGQFHCEHGPAFVLSNGYKAWYLDGVQLTQEEWENILKCPRCG